MKKLLLLTALLLVSANSFGKCTGYGNFKNCYDPRSGNRYSIQKYGNTTQMRGYKANTGSSWNQRITTMGNTTFHSGTDSNGRSWNHTCWNGKC